MKDFIEGIKETKDDKSKYFLRKAYKYAGKNSDDDSIKNGAVLVSPDGEILSFGANHFPDNTSKADWKKKNEETILLYINHAERDAIYNAARNGVKTKGLVMYCPWFACRDCARAVIQSGIKKVVGHKEVMEKTPLHWRENIRDALSLMREAGVELELYSGKIGGVKGTFLGEWKP